MKVSSVVLAVVMCSQAPAQTSVLMNGSAVQNGVGFSYETRLEPPTPPFAGGFVGGAVTDPEGIHRYLAYKALHKFFGYDLQVDHAGEPNSYRVTFRPLSIGPARIELEDPPSWTVVAMPTVPAPQEVHAGDSIALDLFTNSTTGQKIVEYLHFPKAGGNDRVYQIADVLTINVIGQPELGERVAVNPDGFISLRSAGEVKAAGLTMQQLSRAIEQRLAKDSKHPIVRIQIDQPDSPKFYISGEIRKPGPYLLTTPKTVLEAITQAGGPNDFAKVKKIYILRGQQKLPFNYADVSRGWNLEQNVTLQNGDVIYVP
jgi:polysaccharide export outer membrane protein